MSVPSESVSYMNKLIDISIHCHENAIYQTLALQQWWPQDTISYILI